MNSALRILGAVLILIVLQDIFFTVLFPASGQGVIRKPVSKGIWQIFRLFGKMTTGQRRRSLFAYCGPIVITVTLLVWFVLLVMGWAMIYKPALGIAIRDSAGETDTQWTTAIYYSGYAFTTLGTGDVVAKTGLYRILTIVEAATGFAVISLVITYFQSIYSSLISRNAFAQGLHYFSRCTDDAAELLAGLADGPELPNIRQHLSSMASFLQQIYQTHRFYPVLRYFLYKEHYYALPCILLTILDMATLLQTALDKVQYSGIVGSPTLDELFKTGMALLDELISDVESIQSRSPSPDMIETWRSHYFDATARLADAGLQICEDREAGAAAYVNLRAEWDQLVQTLAKTMLYEWRTQR